jgi:branched-chain amino acid transport system substrate-binding protein
MQTRRSLLKLSVATTALLAANIATPAHAADDLVWSVHVDITGPAAYSGSAEGEGFRAFVAWKNAQGGIRGRKIALTVNDTTFQPAVGVANFKKALAQGRVDYLYADSTAMVQGVSPENNATAKVLMGSGSLASEMADKDHYPYHFVAGATYGDQLALLITYIKQSYKGATPIRLAIVHSSIALGRDGIEQAQSKAKELGIEVVLVQQTKFVEADVGAYGLAIRQARPTHVLMHGYAYAVWPEIMRLVRDYGLKDTQFLGSFWQNEREKVMELGDIADGLIGITVFTYNTKTSNGAMMKVIDEIETKKNPKFDGYVKLGFLDGWLNGMLAAKAFEMVIDAGKPVNGDTLSEAMSTLKDWDTGGIVGIPVSMRGHQLGTGQIIRWNKAKNWTPEPVSDWMRVD